MSVLDGCTCGSTATMLPACPIHPQPATVQVRPPDTPDPSHAEAALARAALLAAFARLEAENADRLASKQELIQKVFLALNPGVPRSSPKGGEE